MLPTQQVKEGMADWNAWLHDWMAIWAAQPNDNFLGMCIMGLVSRVARNDTQCKSHQSLDIALPLALQIRTDKCLPDCGMVCRMLMRGALEKLTHVP